MPAVLIHGNPEIAALWDDLIASLGRTDVIALSPPGNGEQAIADMAALSFQARARRYETFGMSEAVAAQAAAAFDGTMGRCLLALYRSAAQPALMHWGKRLARAAAKPGLMVVATKDHFVGGEILQRRSAGKAGADVAVLHGAGHWWMCEDPACAAQILRQFWSDKFLRKQDTQNARLAAATGNTLDPLRRFEQDKETRRPQ